jgi:phosphoribosylglycinamide formyltransferase-1
MARKRLRVCVGADGSGTCFQSVIDGSNFYDFDVVAAYTNNPGCFAMERAARHGIPKIEIDPKAFGKGMEARRQHEVELEKRLDWHDFDVIVMLGDDRLKTGEFIADYAKRGVNVLNTHPAPDPQFRGRNGYAWALGEHPDAVRRNEWTAVTFHRIDAEMDRGNIIAQCPAPIYEGDTVNDLKERGLKVEHFQIVQCLQYLAMGKMSFREEGMATIADNAGMPIASQFNVIGEEIARDGGRHGLEVEINTMNRLWKVRGNGREESGGIRYGTPKNLVFTYAYDIVKKARLHGWDVKFTYDGMNIHPIIMKSDQEKGEKPY